MLNNPDAGCESRTGIFARHDLPAYVRSHLHHGDTARGLQRVRPHGAGATTTDGRAAVYVDTTTCAALNPHDVATTGLDYYECRTDVATFSAYLPTVRAADGPWMPNALRTAVRGGAYPIALRADAPATPSRPRAPTVTSASGASNRDIGSAVSPRTTTCANAHSRSATTAQVLATSRTVPAAVRPDGKQSRG